MRLGKHPWLTVGLLLFVSTIFLLAGCSTVSSPSSVAVTTPATETKVTGTITYLEKMALPTGSVIEVKLLDVSKQDVPSVSIGEQVITTTGQQVPLPFEVKYNSNAIDPRFTYAVRATITVEGKPWFITDTRYNVITQGSPSRVDLVLKRMTVQALPVNLEDGIWKLQSYGPILDLKPVLKDRDLTVLFNSSKQQVSGSAGVNQFFGGYELIDNKLSISKQLMSTMMAGPQPLMDQEKQYLSLLQAIESYQIKDGLLQLNSGQQALIFTR